MRDPRRSPAGVAGLKGKSVAGPKGTVLHQLLVAALKRQGLTIQDVDFVQMDIPKAFAAMQSGQVDAALLAANFIIHAEKEGARAIARATGHVRPLLAMTASAEFLKSHPDRIRAVLAAHDEAWQWIKGNPAAAIALGARLQSISTAEAKQLFDWSHFTQRLDAADFEALEADQVFMLDNGMMRNRIDVRDIVAPVATQDR